jgi:hypothetical protein
MTPAGGARPLEDPFKGWGGQFLSRVGTGQSASSAPRTKVSPSGLQAGGLTTL